MSSNHSRLCAKYGFEKPNDRRALELMNAAARAVMTEIPDITIAYGVSDEYRQDTLITSAIRTGRLTSNSFVFHKTCALFERRSRYDSGILAGTPRIHHVLI
jgi:tRNA(His) guanylyltransferase